MANLPGPYEVEFTIAGFTAPVREHKIRMSCAVLGNPVAGTLPTAILVQKSGGGSAALNVVVDQAWSFLRQFFNTGISASGYQLWKYVTGTHAKNFIATGSVTNPAGTGAGSTVAAQQQTLTFRSASGGILKTVLLDVVKTGDTRSALVPNGSGNSAQKWAAYLLSVDNFNLAADDSYPVDALFDSRGQNERIWRKVFRGT